MAEHLVAVISGFRGFQELPSIVVYRPSTNTYEKGLPDLPKPRINAAACVLRNGDIMVCGGRRLLGELKRNTWIYSRLTREWKASGCLNRRQSQHTLIVLEGGDVLSVEPRGVIPVIERWNCRTGKWQLWLKNQLLVKERWAIIQLGGDRLMLMCGKQKLLYSINSNTYQTLAPSEKFWYNVKGCLLSDGRVAVSRSIDGKYTIEIYDFNTNSWTIGPDVSHWAYVSHLASVGDNLYIFNGNLVQIYNLGTKRWTKPPSPETTKTSSDAAVVLYYDTTHYTETLEWKMLRFIIRKQSSPIQA